MLLDVIERWSARPLINSVAHGTLAQYRVAQADFQRSASTVTKNPGRRYNALCGSARKRLRHSTFVPDKQRRHARLRSRHTNLPSSTPLTSDFSFCCFPLPFRFFLHSSSIYFTFLLFLPTPAFFFLSLYIPCLAFLSVNAPSPCI